MSALVNDDLERVCLSGMLCGARHREVALAILQPDDLARGGHRDIFAAIQSLAVSSMDPSVENVAAQLDAHGKLGAGLPALRELRNAFPSATDLRPVCEHLRSLATLRRAQAIGRSLIDEAEASKDDAASFVDGKARQLAELTRASTDGSVPTFREVGHASVTALVNAVRGEHRMWGVPTGFRTLDSLTDGWPAGEFSIIAGRPGMGKSTLAMLSAATIACSGALVYVASLEMPSTKIFDRLVSSYSGVDSRKIQSRSGFTEEDFRKVTPVANTIAGLSIKIDDFQQKPKTPFFIEAGVRETEALAKKHGKRLGGIFVDYIQLMKTQSLVGARANREQEVSAGSQFLLSLAKRYGCPVIGLSQLSRPLKSVALPPPPQLSDLRESGSLEQDASLVVFVHREEFYTRSRTKPDKLGIAEVIVAKNRNGEMGDAEMKFHGPTLTFTDIEEQAQW